MAAAAVLAHGFGIRYDLPVPLAYYMGAAAAVVVLSFVLIALFVPASGHEDADAVSYPRLVFGPQSAVGRIASSGGVRAIGGAIGVLMLVAIVATGLLGAPDATGNPAEYLLWIYFWAGLLLLSGLIGNLYAWLSPWTALHDVGTRFTGPRPPPLRYPERLGIWPASAGFFAFAWFELASGQSANPRSVAVAAIVYTVVTLSMMRLVGRDTWLANGEFFSVLFGLVGAFAPIGARRVAGGREVEIRPWAVGLLRLSRQGLDVVVFVILMLSTLAFDGIEATPAWATLTDDVGGITDALGRSGAILLHTAGILATTLVFLGIYSLFVLMVQRSGHGRGGLMAAATLLVYTLIPIALVYNAAHNYSYMVVQGQGLFPLLADPFHAGWHLLPTSGWKPSFTLADARIVWYLQVVLIVVGHVIAVYVAHRRALILYRPPRLALRSQYPMLVLMVIYTATSLWILAQPITE